MKANIFCPGPSLRTAVPAPADLTIAVNRAIAFNSADVWAAGDIPMLCEDRPNIIGQPELFTAANTAAYLRDHGPAWRGKVTEFESLFSYLDPRNLSWTMFTFTASIVYASHAGASQIEIYGCDWSGVEDWDKWAKAGNRSDERWKLERQIFERLTGALAARGVEVKRVQPAGQSIPRP